MTEKLHEYLEKNVKKPIVESYNNLFRLSQSIKSREYNHEETDIFHSTYDMFNKVQKDLEKILKKINKFEKKVTGEHGALYGLLEGIIAALAFVTGSMKSVKEPGGIGKYWNSVIPKAKRILEKQTLSQINKAIELAKKIEVEL